MKNADRPAMPLKVSENRGDAFYYICLTKREYFAAIAMQGLCASNDYNTRLSDIASDSVRLADFMLAELEKE